MSTDPFQHFARVATAEGVHIGRGAYAPYGSVLCEEESRNPRGIIDRILKPGEHLYAGEKYCHACVTIALGAGWDHAWLNEATT